MKKLSSAAIPDSIRGAVVPPSAPHPLSLIALQACMKLFEETPALRIIIEGEKGDMKSLWWKAYSLTREALEEAMKDKQ